ncbi:hypothetical protein D3C77_766730 [compost metagenome]
MPLPNSCPVDPCSSTAVLVAVPALTYMLFGLVASGVPENVAVAVVVLAGQSLSFSTNGTQGLYELTGANVVA